MRNVYTILVRKPQVLRVRYRYRWEDNIKVSLLVADSITNADFFSVNRTTRPHLVFIILFVEEKNERKYSLSASAVSVAVTFIFSSGIFTLNSLWFKVFEQTCRSFLLNTWPLARLKKTRISSSLVIHTMTTEIFLVLLIF